MEKPRVFQRDIYFFMDYAKVFDCGDHNKIRKILHEMRVPDHSTYLLRNLYAGQKAVTWNMEQNCERSTSRLYVVTLLFIMYAEYIMEKAGLDES